MALGLTHPLTEMRTSNIPGVKAWWAFKANDIAAIYEPIV
jgi:hypothetical protein